ncbi:MAG: DNA/RNA non-specific endonuclease [Calditrichaeota bacterium]|nr:MAG: DNA/RNA non-specific endonuclease [Calditrichota bacterium]
MAKRGRASQGRRSNRRALILLAVVILIAGTLFVVYEYHRYSSVQPPPPPPPPPEVVQPLPEQPGLPTVPPGHQVVEHTYYVLSYNEECEQPDWVMYKLQRRFLQGSARRKDRFRPDPAVITGSATPKDYRRSGYDRGHLLPAADMKFSPEAMAETFFMSNMSPQAPQFNRGIWKKLEEQVREWCKREGELYVVTGPVLQEQLPRIGENKVCVPRYYYKIVLDYEEPEIKAIAFVMENRKLPGNIFDYAVPIDSVEALTGLDFFAPLPDSFEDSLEATINPAPWKALLARRN